MLDSSSVPGRWAVASFGTRVDVRVEDYVICSVMSRRGNCHDNAAKETWSTAVKFETGETCESIGRAKGRLFAYLEVFYQRHS